MLNFVCNFFRFNSFEWSCWKYLFTRSFNDCVSLVLLLFDSLSTTKDARVEKDDEVRDKEDEDDENDDDDDEDEKESLNWSCGKGNNDVDNDVEDTEEVTKDKGEFEKDDVDKNDEDTEDDDDDDDDESPVKVISCANKGLTFLLSCFEIDDDDDACGRRLSKNDGSARF